MCKCVYPASTKLVPVRAGQNLYMYKIDACELKQTSFNQSRDTRTSCCSSRSKWYKRKKSHPPHPNYYAIPFSFYKGDRRSAIGGSWRPWLPRVATKWLRLAKVLGLSTWSFEESTSQEGDAIEVLSFTPSGFVHMSHSCATEFMKRVYEKETNSINSNLNLKYQIRKNRSI